MCLQMPCGSKTPVCLAGAHVVKVITCLLKKKKSSYWHFTEHNSSWFFFFFPFLLRPQNSLYHFTGERKHSESYVKSNKLLFQPYYFMSLCHIDITPISTFCHFACCLHLWYCFKIQYFFFLSLTALRQALTFNIWIWNLHP